ncbi:MAG: 1-acyl-sn-glycerol-3-phosphate acyltransferase [Cytophagales bacterium]|nr:1-acyl-sn-glycerol-3-phosphate acyltransferase [Cytophagales bacterium]
MTKILSKVYFFYATIVFLVVFLILYPFFFISVQHRNLYMLGHWTNRIWGYMVLTLCGIPYIIQNKPKVKVPVVYCANHSSYIDIPALYCAIFENINFIGKASLAKVPLFGYMYSRLHIIVDRRNAQSKFESIDKAMEAIAQGISVVVFPEGTIPSHASRQMIPFKDGAFRIAIEKQVCIVPVVLPHNHYILPDIKSMMAHWRTCKVIFLAPVDTTGYNISQIQELKQNVYQAMQTELNKYPLT